MTTHAAARTLRMLGTALTLASAAAGAWYGFDFGLRAGGVPVGTLAAVNCAALCSLIADELLERVLPRAA